MLYEVVKRTESYYTPPLCDDDDYYGYLGYETFECIQEDQVEVVATETLAKAYVDTMNKKEGFVGKIEDSGYGDGYFYRKYRMPDVLDEAYAVYTENGDKPYRIFFTETSLNEWLKDKKRDYRVEVLK